MIETSRSPVALLQAEKNTGMYTTLRKTAMLLSFSFIFILLYELKSGRIKVNALGENLKQHARTFTLNQTNALSCSNIFTFVDGHIASAGR